MTLQNALLALALLVALFAVLSLLEVWLVRHPRTETRDGIFALTGLGLFGDAIVALILLCELARELVF